MRNRLRYSRRIFFCGIISPRMPNKILRKISQENSLRIHAWNIVCCCPRNPPRFSPGNLSSTSHRVLQFLFKNFARDFSKHFSRIPPEVSGDIPSRIPSRFFKGFSKDLSWNFLKDFFNNSPRNPSIISLKTLSRIVKGRFFYEDLQIFFLEFHWIFASEFLRYSSTGFTISSSKNFQNIF